MSLYFDLTNYGVVTPYGKKKSWLTHWGRVTHICVGKLTIIGSDNGLSPGWCQAIIWTNAGILLIRPLGTNFSEILIGIQTFSFKKMRWKCCLPNGIYQPQCVNIGCAPTTLPESKSTSHQWGPLAFSLHGKLNGITQDISLWKLKILKYKHISKGSTSLQTP